MPNNSSQGSSSWMPTADYINAFDFDYMETYSFNRFNPQQAAEYNELSKRREQGGIPTAERKRWEELETQYNGFDLLVNSKGAFHPSAVKLATFQVNDPLAIRFKQILQMEAFLWSPTLCAPYYRDAVVFYDASNKVVSVLNICLSCLYMTDGNQFLKADFEVYDLVKKFFLENGHQIEEPHTFMMKQFGEMKAKKLAEREAKRTREIE